MNEGKFQAKVDFKVGDTYVDVKASSKKDGYKNNPRKKKKRRHIDGNSLVLCRRI